MNDLIQSMRETQRQMEYELGRLAGLEADILELKNKELLISEYIERLIPLVGDAAEKAREISQLTQQLKGDGSTLATKTSRRYETALEAKKLL